MSDIGKWVLPRIPISRKCTKAYITATPVHDIAPPSGHLEKNAPLLLARIHTRLLWDVVAVIDDVGTFVSSMNFDSGTVIALSALPPRVMRGGNCPSGKESRSPARRRRWRGHSCS